MEYECLCVQVWVRGFEYALNKFIAFVLFLFTFDVAFQ